jgi:hypothetical protein
MLHEFLSCIDENKSINLMQGPKKAPLHPKNPGPGLANWPDEDYNSKAFICKVDGMY